jgi:outer membrane protein TolC
MKKVWGSLFVLVIFAAGAGAADLNESVNLALQNNPTVIAAQKKAAAAKARYNQALSAFFPTVNLSGDYDKAYSSPQTIHMNTGGTSQNVTIGVNETATVSGLQADLTQPVFVSALFPEYGMARKGFEAASEEYNQTVVETNFNVSQAYFGVLKAIKLEKLMEDSLAMARSHREQVQSMLNAGMVTRADLLRSKVREADSNVDLIQSRYDIDLSRDAYNNVLGNDIKQPVELKDIGFTGKVDNLPEFDALLKMAYECRPDWKIYLLETGIGEDQVRISQSEYFPNIVLSANSGSRLTRYPSYSSDVSSWKVMGSGSWKIFDSLGRENRVREAAENLEAQRANMQQAKNNIALEVHSTYLSLKNALDVVIASQQQVDSAQESYKVATTRYIAGMGTNVDVLDAQTDLTRAWTEHLDALFDVEIARAQINKVVGKDVL